MDMDVDDPSAAWVAALQSKCYPQVEQRVVRQLLQTLMYEGVLPFEVLAGATPEAARVFLVEGKTADDQVVRYHCSGRVAESFGLIKLDDSAVLRSLGDGAAKPASLSEVSSEVVAQVVRTEQLPAFIDELEQTLVKDVQAQSQLRPDRLPADQRHYDELEGNIMDAHAYHPCYKSRIGFSLRDNRLYGPEFKQPLQLGWIAVHRQSSRMNFSVRIDGAALVRQELGDATYQRFALAMSRQGRDIDDYWLIPVHPWQWEEQIAARFHPELAQGEVVWLGSGGDCYRAQQSIRTLANYTAPEKCYVKLSLSITNTSTSRILAAHTVVNGPIVTDWLRGLIERDSVAVELDFVILGEVLGITYDYERMPDCRRSLAYGTLGAIWRESLHRYLRQGESAVPFNGLCHVERDGHPLIDPWIREHGLRPWIEQLLRVTVSPIIHMLFAHGIGMESHAQNIMLIHREGWPARVALKDFHDGVRFSPDHLAHPEHCPRLAAVPPSHARINRNSFILTDDLDAVRDFSCDSFFFICLAELAIFLARHYRLAERDFWFMTAQVVRDYQARHSQHEARFRAFDVFCESFQVEALAKRRLLGDGEPRVKTAPNPLYAFRSRRC